MHDHPTIKVENGKVKGSTAKSDALSKRAKVGKEIRENNHTHSYNHADVGRDVFGKGGYACTSCGKKK